MFPALTIMNPHTTSAPRTFQVFFKNMWGRTVLITDPTRTTTYYTIDARNRKPHYTFHDANGKSFAVANNHYAKHLSFVVHGNEFEIPFLNGFLDTEFAYASPAFGGETITWKAAGVIALGEVVCVDSKDRKLGRFNQVGWYKAAGTIDLSGDVRFSQEMIDELVVVGLAVSQHRVSQSATAVGMAVAIV